MYTVIGSGPADMIWPWLFPLTYLIHIAEEYRGGGGYSEHLSRTKGVELPSVRFLSMNALGVLLMIAGIFVAARLNWPQLLLVIYGTITLVNGLSHTATGVIKASYNPGLISAALIWVPLGAVTLVLIRGTVPAPRFLTGLAIGLGIQVTVSLLALRGGRVFSA